MSHGSHAILVLSLCLGLASSAVPAGARGSSFSDLQVHLGAYGPQWGMYGGDVDLPPGSSSDPTAGRGSWEAEPERDGDRLRIRVTMTPPAVNPALGPATASLVTGFGVEYGRTDDGGDIGYGRTFGFSWTALGPCSGDPCAYHADLSVPLRPAVRFYDASRNLERGPVVIGFTLVRTFGRGEWVQTSGAYDIEDGRQSTALSKLTKVEGWIPPAAVIPSDSAHIWGLGDGPNVGVEELSRLVGTAEPGSSPVPTVTVSLHVRATGCDAHESVRLVDAWGTVPVAGSIATLGPAGTLVAAPDGTTWSVMVGSTLVGEIEAAGADRIVKATVRCDTDAEGGTITGTISEAREAGLPTPPPAPAWLVAVESPRVDLPPRSALLAATTDGFLAVERRQPRRWTVERSEDGLRWEPVADARLPRTLLDDDVRDPRLISEGDRVLLAGIVKAQSGGSRFAAWTTTDGRRWRAAHVRHAGGHPAAASLSLRALVTSGSLWFALADGDGATGAYGWASEDGRTWSAMEPRLPEGTSLVAVGGGRERLLGVARPGDPKLPDLLVDSPDGREWRALGPLPVGRAETVSVAETSSGTVVAAFARSAVSPIEAFVSADGGGTWSRTLDGSVGLRLEEVTVRDRTVVVTGSARFGAHGLESSPWVALSQDDGETWHVDLPVNGYGDGRCATAAVIGREAAVVTVNGCSGNPAPRWRAALEPLTDGPSDG